MCTERQREATGSNPMTKNLDGAFVCLMRRRNGVSGGSAGTWTFDLGQRRQHSRKQDGHAGLTSCSAPRTDSEDRLEFLLLLKADMLEGQMEVQSVINQVLAAAWEQKDSFSKKQNKTEKA